MLLALRSTAGKWIIRVLFGLLVVSFALWGVEDFVRTQHSKPVVRVGDIRVDGPAYAREFDRSVEQLRSSFGPDFDSAKARQFGVDRQILSQIVSRSLFDSQIGAMHLTVPDANLADEIRSSPLFQDQSGQFDRTRFEAILRENSLTEQRFAAMLRGDLNRRQLVSSVSGGISGPEPFARLLYIYRNERRAVRAFALPVSAAKDVAVPSDADLQAYYKAHADVFALPEYRKISFFTVRPEDIAAKMTIPEAELRQAYEDRKASFSQPEKRDFRQMLFRTKDQAEAAADKLRADLAPAAVAKAAAGLVGDTEVKGASRDELLPEVAEAVFATPTDKVGGPVESPLGWVVVRIGVVTQADTKAFEAVREDLRLALAGERANDRMYEISNQIEDERAGGATLDDVAKTLGVSVRTVDAVDRAGKAPDGADVADLPDNPKFLETAFESGADQDLDPIELTSGGYALLRVVSIIPARTPDFAQIADQVRERQQADARQEALKALAGRLTERERKGEDFAALAREIGQPVRDLKSIPRDYKGEVLPPDLVRALFAVPQNGIASGPGDDGYVVAQVTGIMPADPATHPDDVKAVQADIAAAMSEDVLRQYQSALERRFKVEVNLPAADAAIGTAQE